MVGGEKDRHSEEKQLSEKVAFLVPVRRFGSGSDRRLKRMVLI